MAETPSLSESIAESAAAPRRMKGDEGEMEAHSLPDQIAADQYLSSKSVAKRPFRALKSVRIIGPGAV